jgi:hypothetical protein
MSIDSRVIRGLIDSSSISLDEVLERDGFCSSGSWVTTGHEDENLGFFFEPNSVESRKDLVLSDKHEDEDWTISESTWLG